MTVTPKLIISQTPIQANTTDVNGKHKDVKRKPKTKKQYIIYYF